MRALVLTLLILPLQLVAQLNPFSDSKHHLSPTSTPRGFQQDTDLANRNTVLLFEDFQETNVPEIPTGWDGGPQVEQQQNNNEGVGLGTFVDAWKTGGAYEANNGGYLPVPHIDDNLFVYVNDDGNPCNCDMEDVSLTLPEFNFQGLENMMMTFDVYSQSTFGGDNISLAISTNGSDFITLYTAESNPEWQPAFIDLSLWDDEPSVWLRFSWSDNGLWSSGVAIDNILVAENDDYNAGIIRAHAAQYTADWNDTTAISGEYSLIPLEQTTALVLGATIKNKGALQISDVVLAVSIFNGNGLVGTFNSQIEPSMYPGEEQEFYVYTGFTPDELGAYTIDYELMADQDEVPGDNSATRQFEISSDIYALDDGNADSFRDNTGDSFTIGNLFEIPNDGSTCYSIGVAIGSNSISGTEVFARIYNSEFLFVAGSSAYSITPQDVNQIGDQTFVNIPLSEPLTLEGGKDYIAAITYFAEPNSAFTVSNSGISQEQFSVFQDEFGGWFFVTTTPMIRMNLSSTVSLSEQPMPTEPIIFPNPVSESFGISWPTRGNENCRVSISDSQGRIIRERLIHPSQMTSLSSIIDASGLAGGIYQLTISQGVHVATTRFVKGR